VFILKHNIKGMRPCNNCFSRLPGGKTFSAVFDDASVFISFDPSGPDSGATDAVGGKEITISVKEFKVGRWSVAATLVHELAHVNGTGVDTADAVSCCHCRAHVVVQGKVINLKPGPRVGGSTAELQVSST
jgi:hypothetical protein